MRVKFDLRNKVPIFFFLFMIIPHVGPQPQPIWAGVFKAGLR